MQPLTVAIFSTLFLIIYSQNISNSFKNKNCFPLYSGRFLSCPPGYGPQYLSQPPPLTNILEGRLFIRKLRNPIISEAVICCGISSLEEEDSEKLSSSQIQFPNNIRKYLRQRRRRRRGRPRSRIHAIINKLGESVDKLLNTSLSYRQHDGWTWTLRPLKYFSLNGENQGFEKYRTRRRRKNRNQTNSPRPPPPTNSDVDVDAENLITKPPPTPPPSSSAPPTPPLKLIRQEKIMPSLSPYVISIRRNGDHFCSGVVMDSKHILTAANCFISPIPGATTHEIVVNVDPDGVRVNIGQGNNEEYEVDHICVHSSIPNPTKEFNEVAVLTLAKPLVFSGEFYPARLLWEWKGEQGANNYGRWFSSADEIESAPTKAVAQKLCTNRHLFTMRKEEFCLQLGGRRGKLCSKSDFLGGILECPSGLRGQPHVCGVITETSCPPQRIRYKKNPVTKISPVPKWIYPILSSNSYRNCF